MAFSFQKPRYLSKRVNPITQKPEPSYQFDIQYHGAIEESPLTWIAYEDMPFCLSSLIEELTHQLTWWNSLINQFLQATKAYFSKPYTVQQLLKIIQHRMDIDSDITSYPLCVYCIPNRIEFVGGVMYVDWIYTTKPAWIHIPVEDQENTDCPVSLNEKVIQDHSDLEEWDPDMVPMTGENVIEDGAKQLDKQRVREARLKAKVAMYRAQYQMNRFYDKYGDEVSDSDSNATSDAETDNEEDDEEDNL